MPSQSIPVFIINLGRRPDRMAYMAGQCAALGIAFQRIDAIDGMAAPAQFDRDSPAHGSLGPLTPSTRACSASHIRAWQRLVDSGASHALILEDDAELLPGLRSVVAGSDWISPKAELIKLEKFNADRVSRLLLGPSTGGVPGLEGSALREMFSRHTGSAGYLISRAGAARALLLRNRMTVPVDHFLFNETASPLLRGGPRPRLLLPAQVSQARALVSDIAQAAPGNMSRGWRGGLPHLRHGLLEVRLLHKQIGWLLSGRATLVKVGFERQPPVAGPGEGA